MASEVETRAGDALELLDGVGPVDLVVTDPPYAFGGARAEHELTATVAIVLRETARLLNRGCWMVVFCASSWRSTAYMVDSLRGVVEPVRFGVWTKPRSRSKTRTPGWAWASVNVLAFRKGKSIDIPPTNALDWISEAPVLAGRRAQLPEKVADWAVAPFAIPGGLMLDPFAGSGALPAAATRHGMRAIGLEKDPPQPPASPQSDPKGVE